jgi:hypothetical protein
MCIYIPLSAASPPHSSSSHSSIVLQSDRPSSQCYDNQRLHTRRHGSRSLRYNRRSEAKATACTTTSSTSKTTIIGHLKMTTKPDGAPLDNPRHSPGLFHYYWRISVFVTFSGSVMYHGEQLWFAPPLHALADMQLERFTPPPFAMRFRSYPLNHPTNRTLS